MAYLLVSRQRLGLAGLVVLFASGPVAAQVPQLKVDCTFKVDVKLQDPYLQNLAPWWTYFPQDPHLMAAGSRPSVYPSWPQPFPPETPKDGSSMSRPQGQRPPGPMVDRRTPFSPTAQAYPSWVQPAGYYSTQAPSYWYGR